ncbi:hypothetical protein CS0771_25770 [Catellatospora sp. IY07-71]|nr:hypothetical protein CS0771_25770 [Catellatospora sp. IY07-71]
MRTGADRAMSVATGADIPARVSGSAIREVGWTGAGWGKVALVVRMYWRFTLALGGAGGSMR